MMSAVRQVAGHIWQLAGTAVWGWLTTLLCMSGVGLLCAGASYLWLRGHSPYDIVLATLAFVECLVAGWMLANKRGTTSALVKGIEKLGIGRSTVSHLFDRVEKLVPDAVPAVVMNPANSDAAVADAIALNPPRPEERRWTSQQIEEWIQQAVASVAGERTKGATSWIFRLLQSRLLKAVESVIGQRARKTEGSHPTGVTLQELRTDLESQADQMLTSRFRGMAFKSTCLILGGLFTGLLLQSYVAGQACDYFQSSPAASVETETSETPVNDTVQ